MQLAYELSGPDDAPVVVLIHGITESHHSWRPVIEELHADHRVLAVDLRGHGASATGTAYDPLSYAGDVAETVAALGLREPLVVGHSLGGVVATAYPLVGACVAVVNVDQPLRLAGFKDALAPLAPMLNGTAEQFAAAMAMIFGQMDGPLPPDERERIAAGARPDQQVVLGTWAGVMNSAPEELDALVEQIAAGVAVPYLAVHGSDPGAEYVEWLTRLIPTATVEVWTDHAGGNLGHYPQLVDTQRFLTRLAAFEHQARG